jgi:hypothetical protein
VTTVTLQKTKNMSKEEDKEQEQEEQMKGWAEEGWRRTTAP